MTGLRAFLTLGLCSLLFVSCESTGTKSTSSTSSARSSSNVGNSSATNRSQSASLEAVNQRLVVGKDRHGMPTYHERARHRVVRATAYYHGEADHIQYGRKSAYGTTLRYGRVRSAAADWSRYPVGTVFRIKGLPYTYVVDDYGSALVGTNTVDLYKPSRRQMDAWGLRFVEIEVLRMGSFEESYRVLSSRLRFPHCRQMAEAIAERRPWVVARANQRSSRSGS